MHNHSTTSNNPPPLPLHQPAHGAPKPVQPRLSQELAWVGSLLFLAIALLLLLLGQAPAWSSLVGNIAINFLAVMVEALPFMLIGSLAGGLIEVFVPATWVERVVRQHRIRAVLLAGLLGLLLPVCECAIVPVVRRLLGKGVPLAAALTFLLAGPIVNGIVAASTAIAYSYDWIVPAVRLASGYLIAVVVGLVLGRWFNRDNGLLPQWNSGLAATCGHQGCSHGGGREASRIARLRHALEHASDDFFGVGFYLVIGAFIAASFRSILPGSAQMAFMVLGPMLDLKLLLMYLSVFRKRLIVALAVTVPLAVLLVMLGLQRFFPDLL